MGKKIRRPPGSIGTEPTGWTQTVIICRKCSKKLDGGFGPEGTQTLRGALRDALRKTGRRGQVGLLEVGCLGLCPRGAVTVAVSSAPAELLVVARGVAAADLLCRACNIGGAAQCHGTKP